jgi:hypothetical protein
MCLFGFIALFLVFSVGRSAAAPELKRSESRGGGARVDFALALKKSRRGQQSACLEPAAGYLEHSLGFSVIFCGTIQKLKHRIDWEFANLKLGMRVAK